MQVIFLFFVSVLCAALCLEAILGFFYPVTPTFWDVIFLSAFTGVWTLTFLIQSSLGLWILKKVMKRGPLTKKEHQKISPLLKEVQDAIFQKKDLAPLSLEIVLEASPFLKCAAWGRKTLFLTQTLYETLSDQELKGVFAHELAHLHSGHAQRMLCARALSFLPEVLGSLLKKSAHVSFDLSQHLRGSQKERLPFIVFQMMSFFKWYSIITWRLSGKVST